MMAGRKAASGTSSRRRNTARASIGMKMEGAEALIEALGKLAVEAQIEISRKCLAAGLEPIREAMIPLTPKSRNNRAGQSKKMRKQWESSKPLHTTIRAVVRGRKKYGVISGALGLVGPSYSDGGGHGNLFARQHKSQNWWGRPATRSRIIDNFVKRAADQAGGAARAKVISTLRSELDSAAKRLLPK
jgi:hypothetical protein